jgi:hypothetical protein
MMKRVILFFQLALAGPLAADGVSGNLGVRAHMVDAWFDNVVVLPIDWDRE